MSVNRHDRWYESISRIRAPIFGLDWVTSNGLWSREFKILRQPTENRCIKFRCRRARRTGRRA
jgi:hypothetical protein